MLRRAVTRVLVKARFAHPLPSIAPVVAICGFCVFCCVVAAGSSDVPVFVPAAETEGAPELDGATWVGAGPMHSIRLTRIGNEARQAYIRESIGSDTDPFTSRPDQPEGHLTYLLQISNPGDSALIFNAGHCWLFTGKEIRTPLGPADISFAYKVAESGFPPAYENVGRVLLHGTQMIDPGKSIHGLLVYRAPKQGTRKFKVDVQLSLGTGDIVKFSAPYRRMTKKELRQR